jgi:G3E family GTPase
VPGPARQIPISLLTGFLGSGKTTVLNHLLRQPAMAKVMVIINEFGEIGLDHELVESATDDIVLLQSGCLCCTVRSDLIEALQDLLRKRDRKEIPEFNRVVIETTGLADPAPILQAFMTDPAVTNRLRLDGVITTVDAVAGEATLDRHAEAVKQAAVADRLLLTKTDMADAPRCAAMEERLKALNPAAPVLRTATGRIEPKALFDVGLYDPTTKSVDVQRWLDDEAYAEAGRERHQRHSGHEHRHGAHDVNRHDDHIHAVCLVMDELIPGEALDHWLKSLFLLRGSSLLRFKAIINIAGLQGPVVLQGVQHVIYPPTMLDAWPGSDRRTRMVFITEDIDEATLRTSFEQSMANATP